MPAPPPRGGRASRRAALLLVAYAIYAPLAVAQQIVVHGTVNGVGAAPIPYAYVSLTDSSFATAAQGATDAHGAFSFTLAKPLKQGYVIVQPPPKDGPDGIGAYANAPRIFLYDGENPLNINLPPATSIVLRAYDQRGHLMRWEDFKKQGLFADQFMFATDMNDCAIDATCWPVFDEEARKLGQPREKGLPALIVPPGTRCVPQVLFWETKGYGKLQLRADNDGNGFVVTGPGAARSIELNLELAHTAVNDLVRRKFTADAVPLQAALGKASALSTPQARAAAADIVLADALRLRDTLELQRARDAIKTLPGPRDDFTFGVFEGSPYNAAAFKLARDAGFDLATVLLGWSWTDAKGGAVDTATIEQTFGIDKLRDLGYQVKAHGVVWLQDYGILPDRAKTMDGAALEIAILAQEKALLDAYAKKFSIWEVMNEPNVTNVLGGDIHGLPASLLKQSSKLLTSYDNLISLVNSAHEGRYGSQFGTWHLDGTPTGSQETYYTFLKNVAPAEDLKGLKVIGLQYYPGFHFNESFGGLQGPATTPSWLVDTFDRYATLKRPLHVTEFSVPSTHPADWTSGYWREPWTEQTQADYAEIVFTLAYANPNAHSISWWDIMDKKSSVTTGGLCDINGKPKPAFDRLKSFIASTRGGGK